VEKTVGNVKNFRNLKSMGAGLIFTCRKDGKLRCRRVCPGQEGVLWQAIENGRPLERLPVEAGEELLRSLRDGSCVACAYIAAKHPTGSFLDGGRGGW
jgi:hypothetical protein